MASNNKQQYYVVEFLNPPQTDFEKYVCVPDSWMGLRDFETETAVVRYPIEEVSVTEKRVENREKFSREWPFLEVYVKFSADTYSYAKKFVTYLHNILSVIKRIENIDLKNDATEIKPNELLVDPNSKEHNSTTVSHDSNLIESTSKPNEKYSPDLLTKLKNMDSSIESRCEHIERALQEHKKQSMIIKSMIKSIEKFDDTFDEFISDISHSSTILSVNDENKDDDAVLVADNDDQNVKDIIDRRNRKDNNGKTKTNNIVEKKRTRNSSSDSDSNGHVKTIQVINRKKMSKDGFYKFVY